jgi:hypothetical protein
MRTPRIVLLVAVLVVLFGTACTHADGNFQRTFTVTGAPDVEINNGTGNVTVRTGDVNSVQVSAEIEAFALSPEFVVERIEKDPPLLQSGNRIHIGRGRSYNDPFREVSIHYTVTVPANTRLISKVGTGDQDISGIKGSLKAESGTGNLRISDCTNEARINAGTGSIDAEHVDGIVALETGTGDIHLQTSKATRAEASTGTGNIVVESIEGPLTAHTGTGDINVDGLPTAMWQVGTGTGNVAFRAQPKASYRLEAHGSISRVNFGSDAHSVRNEDDHHALYAEVGNGGPRVELSAGTGNIDIN